MITPVTKNLPPGNITWATTTQNMWYVSTIILQFVTEMPCQKMCQEIHCEIPKRCEKSMWSSKKKVKMWPKDCAVPSPLSYLIFFGWNRILADKERRSKNTFCVICTLVWPPPSLHLRQILKCFHCVLIKKNDLFVPQEKVGWTFFSEKSTQFLLWTTTDVTNKNSWWKETM